MYVGPQGVDKRSKLIKCIFTGMCEAAQKQRGSRDALPIVAP